MFKCHREEKEKEEEEVLVEQRARHVSPSSSLLGTVPIPRDNDRN